jgi:hypothetical protein
MGAAAACAKTNSSKGSPAGGSLAQRDAGFIYCASPRAAARACMLSAPSSPIVSTARRNDDEFYIGKHV